MKVEKLIRKRLKNKDIQVEKKKIIAYWEIAICDGPVILGLFHVSLCKLVDNCLVEQCSTWSFFCIYEHVGRTKKVVQVIYLIKEKATC